MISIVKSATWTPATKAMAALILIALGLRVWGVWFGLPFVFHNDESIEVIRALRMGAGEFDFDRIGKGGYFYVLFVEYGFLFIGLKIIGVVKTANEFAEYFITDPSAFYFLGRFTTAVIGTINVLLVYRIGRLAYSTTAGVVAAVLLTLNILHAELSHFITVDVPMTCLATATLYFAVKISMTGLRSDYYWAALFAAFATATKIPAVLLVIPLVSAHYFYSKDMASELKPILLSKLLWQSVVIFVGIYVVLSPGILINFSTLLTEMLGKFGISSGSAVEATAVEVNNTPDVNLFIFYLSKIWTGMGAPVFLLCTAGLAYGIWKREKADVILISFAAALYLVLSLSSDSREFFPRYILPVIPVLAIMGGRFLAVIVEVLVQRNAMFVSSLVVIAITIIPAYTIGASNYEMSQQDTRTMAKDWIDSTIPAGSKIFIEGSATNPLKSTVPLQKSADNIRAIIASFEDEPGKARYFKTELKMLTGITFDLVFVRQLDDRNLQYFKGLGIQYLVLRPDNYERVRVREGWPELVEAVRGDPDIKMIKSFQPRKRLIPGPLIEIYRVEGNIPSE